MTRLVQLQNGEQRRVAVVEEPRLRLLSFDHVYELAQDASRRNESLTTLVKKAASDETLDYDSVYTGASDWKLLTPIDHPAACSVCARRAMAIECPPESANSSSGPSGVSNIVRQISST